MFKSQTGDLPDPATRQTILSGAQGPVQLTAGPGGDIFYVGLNDGKIHRIQYSTGNLSPTAVASATTTSGIAPLSVTFDATGSTDPEGLTISYAWDLDADGAFDDSTSAQPTWVYSIPAPYNVRLRVTDSQGLTDVASIVITANNSAPTATINSPSSAVQWKVGDVITFSGNATDNEDGSLPPSALSWSLIMHHCPSTCHTHPVQDFPGVASGSFAAPDHEYPSWIELTLSATDSGGLRSTVSLPLNPQTVQLTFQTSPTGLQLAAGPSTGSAPFTRTVIVGSSHSISAPSPQSFGGQTYQFAAWSDGGGQAHNVTAPAAPTQYTASFTAIAQTTGPVAAYGFSEGSGTTATDVSGNVNTGTVSGATWTAAGKYGSALIFDGVNDRVTVPDAPSLDLTTALTLEAWVYPTAAGGWRTVLLEGDAKRVGLRALSRVRGAGVWGCNNRRDRADGHQAKHPPVEYLDALGDDLRWCDHPIVRKRSRGGQPSRVRRRDVDC